MNFVSIGENDELLDFLKNWGLPITQTNLRVLGDSGLVGWQMARQGLGISAMTDDIARHFPEMKLVLPELEPVEWRAGEFVLVRSTLSAAGPAYATLARFPLAET